MRKNKTITAVMLIALSGVFSFSITSTAQVYELKVSKHSGCDTNIFLGLMKCGNDSNHYNVGVNNCGLPRDTPNLQDCLCRPDAAGVDPILHNVNPLKGSCFWSQTNTARPYQNPCVMVSTVKKLGLNEFKFSDGVLKFSGNPLKKNIRICFTIQK